MEISEGATKSEPQTAVKKRAGWTIEGGRLGTKQRKVAAPITDAEEDDGDGDEGVAGVDGEGDERV